MICLRVSCTRPCTVIVIARTDIQRAGTGGKVGIERRIRTATGHAHSPNPCGSPTRPSARPRAVISPLPASRVECPLNAASRNVAGTGMQIDISRSGFFHLNVAAARAASHRTCDPARPHIARTRLQANFPRNPREFHVSRSTLQVDVAAGPFNSLISRAAVRADGRFLRHGDFIIHRNLMSIHIVDADAIPFLPQRRMLLNVDLHRRAGFRTASGPRRRSCREWKPIPHGPLRTIMSPE